MDTSTLECSEPYVIVNVKSMGRLENPMLIPQGTGTTPEGAPTTATASSTGPTTATADDYVSPDALSVRKPYIIINVKSLNRIENSVLDNQISNGQIHQLERLSVTTARTCIFIYIAAFDSGADTEVEQSAPSSQALQAHDP